MPQNSPKPRSHATIQLITTTTNTIIVPNSPKNQIAKSTQISKNRNSDVINKKHTPHIVFNIDTQVQKITEKLEPKQLGYKALISSGHLDFNKINREENQPQQNLDDQGDELHQDFLNKTFDKQDTNSKIDAPIKSINISKSPQYELKQAITPPGDKIVIKKSEIRFNGKSPSMSNSPQNAIKKSASNTKLKRQDNKEEVKSPLKDQPKTLAFDFIKKMLNDPQLISGSTQQVKNGKKEGIRLSLSGGNSPYSSGAHKIQKSSINFVHEMKKHGIDKDLDSVKAMRQILSNNSPNAAVSPQLVISNSMKVGGTKLVENLKIKTTFRVEDNNDGTLGSAKSQESNGYMFPFHKRSRSTSPPVDYAMMNKQKSVQEHERDLETRDMIQDIQGNTVFSRACQRASTQQSQQKSFSRISPIAGPVIPGHQAIENVIKASGSPGNIFYQSNGQPTFSFSLKKHAKSAQKKAETQRIREQEELERRILAGTEVDEWLESPQRAVQTQRQISVTEEVKHSQQTVMRQSNINHFQKFGFIGDIDDLDEDDLDQELAENDDWMFQTFTNGGPGNKKERKKDPEESIPQNLLKSLDLGDHHIIVRDDDEYQEDRLSDSELEERVSIPSANLGRISSLVADHLLEFPRNV